jgi:hypothetical protein
MEARRMEQIAVVAATRADPALLGDMDEAERDLFDSIADSPEPIDIPSEIPDFFDSGIRVKDTEATKAVGEFEVSKAVTENRFTLGPMYVPNRLDAHAEWTDVDELQKAVWSYVQKGDRRIRLQHNRDKVAGEWVEVMTWPYEVEVPMMKKDAAPSPVAFPEGTVFLGVVWEPWAWEMVKDGKIRGYSIGGKAERLYVDLEDE